MKILGINDGHNAAACLYGGGRVVAAIQEERLRRVKNWSGMPTEAIQMVLRHAGMSPAQVDFVALNGHYLPFPMTRETLMEEYRTINHPGVTLRRGIRRILKRSAQATGTFRLIQARRKQTRIAPLVEMGFPAERCVFVEHHTAHASAAYFGMGNFSDDILVLTCDGAGDDLCATVSIGRAGQLERRNAVRQSHSLGNIYAMVTYLMGMVPLEHEYKLMGLAPYADPRGSERLYRRFRSLIRFADDGAPVWERAPGCPDTYLSYRFFQHLLERQRFDWIAGGLQAFVEDVLVEWVRRCIAATGIRRLALSGGIFMNVKVNKLIMELPEVDDLFIYPSPGDETNAMGAASWVYARELGTASITPMGDVYWGPQYSDDEVGHAVRGFTFSSPVRCERLDSGDQAAARLLAEGQVVARFRGREEFGARALGNRAILANPQEPGVVRIINEAIKARDFWMPFAPSVLAERASDYLVNPKGIASPYMILSFDTTDRWREFPAAIHPFDRTARPQIVTAELNPAYHTLLREFNRLTGTGVVLCTSFNLHGFPIVSRPEDALDVLNRSGLNHLVIENWVVSKT